MVKAFGEVNVVKIKRELLITKQNGFRDFLPIQPWWGYKNSSIISKLATMELNGDSQIKPPSITHPILHLSL